MKNLGFNDCLKDAYETADLHFHYLHLGYFYSELSKKVNFSRIAPNIEINTERNKIFRLTAHRIKAMLEGIYNKPDQQDLFSYLTLLNATRGIVMAVVEALRNKCFEEKFKQDIFKGSDQYQHFSGIVRFIRNILSHSIRDRIEILDEHISGQRKWWKTRMGDIPIDFYYDYSTSKSFLHVPDYMVEIKIDWDKIIPGKTIYSEVVGIFQTFMLIEFCYNSLCFLHKNYSAPVV